MDRIRAALAVVALLLCGVVWSDARADGVDAYDVGGGGVGWAPIGTGASRASDAVVAYCAANPPANGTCTPGGPLDSDHGCVGTSVQNATCTDNHRYLPYVVNQPCCTGYVSFSGGHFSTWTCNSGYIFNGNFSSPACVVGCSDGSQPVNGQCPAKCNDPPGNEMMPVGTGTPAGGCYNGCKYVQHPHTSIGFSDGTSTAYVSLMTDGSACSTPQAPPPTGDPGCQTFAVSGPNHRSITVCAKNDKSGAVGDAADVQKNGTDLGAAIANAKGVQDNGCVVLVSGGGFCAVGFTPQPDNGTPGKPATPDATETVHPPATPSGTDVTYNYYSPSTMGASTNYGNGGCGQYGAPASDGTCGTTGLCPAGQSKVNGQCSNVAGDTGPGGTCDPTKPVTNGSTKCSNNTGSVDGGTDCSAPPTCTGDAVQCYQDKMSWTAVCVYQQPSNDDGTAAFNQGAGVTGTLQQGGLLQQIGTTMDAGSWFDSNVGNIGTTGSCFDDITVSIPPPIGGTFVIPMSKACGIVKLIRALVLIGAGILAVRIYMGGWT